MLRCRLQCSFVHWASASLHPAQRALSSCPVAGQLGGSRPGKIENNRMAKKKNSPFGLFFSLVSGSYLSSRAVASQVLSAYKGLTSVFGMGTGGTPWLNHRNGMVCFQRTLKTALLFNSLRSSPRPISTGQLRTLLHFHLRPINHVVFMGSYSFRMGDLILRSASRLDAFSVYPIRTWLPSCAIGTTTDSPLVRPSRSSRTKDSSSQISCAHDG